MGSGVQCTANVVSDKLIHILPQHTSIMYKSPSCFRKTKKNTPVALHNSFHWYNSVNCNAKPFKLQTVE